MKIKIAWAWTGLLVLLSPAALSVDYILDTVHTQIHFGVSHMGFSTSQGSFSDFSGSFSYDPDAPAASSVEVVIQTSSLDMDDDTWNEHLSGEQWFNVAKHPNMSFRSTRVVSQDGDNMQVSGELTLLGVTKPVVLDVSINKIGLQMGNPKAGFSASTTIDRTEWGLSAFAPAIGKDVAISIQVEAAPVDDRLEKVVAPTAVLHKLNDQPIFNVNDLVQASSTSTQTGAISRTYIKKGGLSPHHNHAAEETITMISGKIKVLSPDGDFMIGPGDVIDIEPYAEHQLEGIEDAYFIEAFGAGRSFIHPTRKD
jgi:polyisoprenoid-binding protein YceI/quercetin dioxygenase-like cupin family protein